jgi:hypothetical protein
VKAMAARCMRILSVHLLLLSETLAKSVPHFLRNSPSGRFAFEPPPTGDA